MEFTVARSVSAGGLCAGHHRPHLHTQKLLLTQEGWDDDSALLAAIFLCVPPGKTLVSITNEKASISLACLEWQTASHVFSPWCCAESFSTIPSEAGLGGQTKACDFTDNIYCVRMVLWVPNISPSLPEILYFWQADWMSVFSFLNILNSNIRSSSLYINKLLHFNMPEAVLTFRQEQSASSLEGIHLNWRTGCLAMLKSTYLGGHLTRCYRQYWNFNLLGKRKCFQTWLYIRNLFVIVFKYWILSPNPWIQIKQWLVHCMWEQSLVKFGQVWLQSREGRALLYQRLAQGCWGSEDRRDGFREGPRNERLPQTSFSLLKEKPFIILLGAVSFNVWQWWVAKGWEKKGKSIKAVNAKIF